MIDLHAHSTYSDGTLTPSQLALEAARIGLSAAALTDHDTTGGVKEFLAACAPTGVNAAAGVEISAQPESGTMHILGYFIDPDCPLLVKNLALIREGRAARNALIIGKLNSMGIALAREEIEALAGGEVIGRAHFAQALVKKGYAKTVKDAFNRYMAKGRSAYFERERLTPEAGIGMIREAGGVAVLAHPSTLRLGDKQLEKLLARLGAAGLRGLEVYYPSHTPDMVGKYLAMARLYNLAPSGGSDFHGASKPDIQLGSGFGSLRTPDELYEQLLCLRGQ